MEKIKTFAEDKGEEPFDWNEFLNREEYTLEELIKADNLASSWVTCACGNQCAEIPRVSERCIGFNSPVDLILKQLGFEFSDKLECMYIFKKNHNKTMFDKSRKGAKQILEKIEIRSSEILKEMQSGSEKT